MGEKDFRVRKGLIVDGTGTSSIAGSLGIGTTSPSTELHVSGANHPSIRVTGTDNANADPAIELLGTADSFVEGGQLWYDNGTGVLHLASLYNNAAADIQFHTRTGADRSTSNVRMTIEGDGNVGIGTSSPSTKLEVDGTVTATGFSGTVQPKATTQAAGNNTANYYAKLVTFNPGGSTVRDCNLILGVTAHDQGNSGTAIISVKFRSNGTTQEYTADVAFMSKTGASLFDKDAFQIFSDGNLTAQDNNTDIELWVKKSSSYSALEVHEISKAITGGTTTLTYHTDSAWQSSAPTNNTFTTTTQGIELNLDTIVDGSLSATTKSFDIEHPTKEGMRLHHGSLEGPEHGVYHRGVGASSVVELPDYWTGLVDEDSITVQLTPKGSFQQLFVRKVEGNKVHVDAVDGGELSFYYNIYGTRKDVGKMEVEY